MTYEQFFASISNAAPPPGLSVYLQSLWHDAKGDWATSHELIQDVPDRTASRIHAYLHRKEGDDANASYWYNKSGRPVPDYSLEKEWEAIVNTLL